MEVILLALGDYLRLPAIAKQAYDRLKDTPSFSRFTYKIIAKLERIKNSEARARVVYKEINLAVDKLFRNDVVKQSVTCHKGCSACCHSLIGITSEEADLLATKIRRGEVSVDLSLMAVQASTVDNAHAWYRLSYDQRACPFLDNNTKSCKVYEDRPAVCRSNFAVSDPQHCVPDSDTGEMRILRTDEASMILIGAFMSTEESGELPKMVWKRISKKEQDKGLKDNIFL